MVDLGVTEKDFHTEWYLTGRKNQLLQELAKSLGDVEMYKIARELRSVMRELNNLQGKNADKNKMLSGKWRK